jgi:hypothetical protein
MNKFSEILKTALTQLGEDYSIQSSNNPNIAQAVNTIDKALNVSGAVNADSNAKDLRDKLFGTSPDDATNPLHSAFDKIKQNPDNPNLEDHEKEAFLSAAEKLKPTTNAASDVEKMTNPSTTSSSSTTQTQSQTPASTQQNSYTYNPNK